MEIKIKAIRRIPTEVPLGRARRETPAVATLGRAHYHAVKRDV